jgi:chitinase
MAHVTPMMKLNDMYVFSPHLIDHFYAACEKVIASGKEVIFTAGGGEGKVINTVADLTLYRRSIEVGVWSVFD